MEISEFIVVIFILGRHLVYHFLTGNTTLWAPIWPDDLLGNPRREHNFRLVGVWLGFQHSVAQKRHITPIHITQR